LNIRFDGDACSIFALFTDESQEQAKKTMSPLHTKSAWYSSGSADRVMYALELDASTAVYTATKE